MSTMETQATISATAWRCLLDSERTSSSSSGSVTMRSVTRSRTQATNRPRRTAPSTSRTISRPWPRSQLETSLRGVISAMGKSSSTDGEARGLVSPVPACAPVHTPASFA